MMSFARRVTTRPVTASRLPTIRKVAIGGQAACGARLIRACAPIATRQGRLAGHNHVIQIHGGHLRRVGVGFRNYAGNVTPSGQIARSGTADVTTGALLRDPQALHAARHTVAGGVSRNRGRGSADRRGSGWSGQARTGADRAALYVRAHGRRHPVQGAQGENAGASSRRGRLSMPSASQWLSHPETAVGWRGRSRRRATSAGARQRGLHNSQRPGMPNCPILISRGIGARSRTSTRSPLPYQLSEERHSTQDWTQAIWRRPVAARAAAAW